MSCDGCHHFLLGHYIPINMNYQALLTVSLILLLCIGVHGFQDLPCIPKSTNNSIVCVCNSTYCDTITRETLRSGYFMTYTTSNAGKRFEKNTGKIEKQCDNSKNGNNGYDTVIEIQPNKVHQTIEGFGGAVTDTAGLIWKSLPVGAQQNLINTYCGNKGIEYNMLRVPIGSTDFSTRPWTYNEYPVDDEKLTNFTFSHEDINYKIPMIQACIGVATADVEVVSTSWVPPSWMLSKETLVGFRTIDENHYQTYADYACKFAELYESLDINIWGLSVANEPLNGMSGILGGESTLWTVPIMETFIRDYFTPTIRNCSVKGIKVLGLEDQRYALPFWTTLFTIFGDTLSDYIDGVATHFYGNTYTSPGVITRSLRNHPNIFKINTEACTGSLAGEHNVVLGSWSRAKQYIVDILENLNFDFIGWLDWNMCLDQSGGPTWLKNNVDSPIIVNTDDQEFYKQPMYYAFGHFTKFIPRGSIRIGADKLSSSPICLEVEEIENIGQGYYDHVAFWTPQGTIVVVLHNEGSAKTVALQIDDQLISVALDEESIVTVEIFV